MPVLWGINATSSNPAITQLSYTSGGASLATSFTAPRNATNSNGRGCAVDFTNSLIYYAYQGQLGLSNDPHIYLTNFSGTDLGVWLDVSSLVAGLTGINTLTIDAAGGTLWVTSGQSPQNNNGYQISIASKTLLQTVSGMGDFRSGNYINSNTGLAIINRGDGLGPYDLYNLSGGVLTLVTSAFINPAGAGFTGIYDGISFDGTNYIVSNPQGYSGGTTQTIIAFATNGAFAYSVSTPVAPPPGGSFGWLMYGITAGPASSPSTSVHVTYVWPTPIGSTGPVTTPPTTALAAQVNEVTALIQWQDADTVATVTHNFQMPVTYTFPYPNCAQWKPQVILNYVSFVTGAPAALFVASFNPTNIIVEKTNLASTAGTVLVVMRRPWQASQ